ncbi:MAG TPA: BMC domain-containing protein [Acidimicrobiia bacterium]|nr:BMC domain-containing protein [Acidimicrobiia bacterium]
MTAPALALLEFDSVAAGIAAGDAMVKRAPLESVVAGTIQPGHYLVLVTGEVAEVLEAVDAGRATSAVALVDEVVLPDVHPDVVSASRGERRGGPVEALGVVETRTVAATIQVADAGIKGARVEIHELRLGDGLGGRGYVLFGGAVADVEAAVEIGSGRIAAAALRGTAVIAQLHEEMGDELWGHPRFGARLGREGDDAAG